jgi:flagellar basal body rod protein FlgB
MQIYLNSGDPFSFELHVRDKNNVSLFDEETHFQDSKLKYRIEEDLCLLKVQKK